MPLHVVLAVCKHRHIVCKPDTTLSFAVCPPSWEQVSELKADLQEVQAEWEVKLQSLRQEKLAAEAQLRRALVSGGETA